MDREQQLRDADELAVLDLVLAASERRHEVVDAVWEAANEGEAAHRLRELLGVGDEVDPTVVLGRGRWSRVSCWFPDVAHQDCRRRPVMARPLAHALA